MSNSRCAIYARYSSDKQSPTSIEDQVRKCREYAASHGWEVLQGQIYSDGAMSGTSSEDRPGLCALRMAISTHARPFDVLLVDDTSRLSRHQATAMQLFEQFNFQGVRVIAVGQGIDSSNEQADVLMAVHGIMDSQYVKELAKRHTVVWKEMCCEGFTLVAAALVIEVCKRQTVCVWRSMKKKPQPYGASLRCQPLATLSKRLPKR